MTYRELCDMELHEKIQITAISSYVVRVVQGWIYVLNDQPVFVPEYVSVDTSQ